MSNSGESFAGNEAIKRPQILPENLVFQCATHTIWLNENLDVWWHTHDSFDEEFTRLQACEEWGELMAKQTELEALPMSHLPMELQRGFRFQIATAILLLFSEKFEHAKQAMLNAENFYRARTAEKARVWILEAGLAAVIVISLVAVSTGWFGRVIVGQPENFLEKIMLGAFGGVWGAFISLFLRASVLGVDATAGRHLHYLESACRIITGFISGVVFVSAVTAGIVAPDLIKSGAAVIIVLGFSAGFSERFLPTLVGNVEATTRQNKKTVSGKNAKNSLK